MTLADNVHIMIDDVRRLDKLIETFDPGAGILFTLTQCNREGDGPSITVTLGEPSIIREALALQRKALKDGIVLSKMLLRKNMEDSIAAMTAAESFLTADSKKP